MARPPRVASPARPALQLRGLRTRRDSSDGVAWFRSVVTVWASAGHDERAGPPRGVCWTCLERSVPEVAMPFRLEHITLADRVELGCACLLAAGQYGLMTDLAAALGTSRQFLYTLR